MWAALLFDRAKTLKLAIITTAAPPSPNGQARVLGQIFESSMSGCAMYLTDQMGILEKGEVDPGRYFALSPAQFRLTSKIWGRLIPGINHIGGLIRTVLLRADEVSSILRRNSVDVIVGCSGNPFDLLASYLAAKRLHLPFVAYLFDDPIYQWDLATYRYLARISEQIWGRGAAAIVTPNEFLEADVKSRLPSARFHVVRNPVDLTAFPPRDTSQTKSPNATSTKMPSWRLLYVGSVYSAQASSFRNLVTALDMLEGQFVLDIYSAQSSSGLVAKELSSPYVRLQPHVSHLDSIEQQQRADILFLPLAFESPIPEVIRSSAPAKLGEYLAAGRPILVHAPADSFVSELIRKADAGILVNTPNPQHLVDALKVIANDAALRERVTSNAAILAKEFELARSRDAFSSILSELRSHGRR